MNKIFQTILDCGDHLIQRFEENKDENMVKIGIASGVAAIVAACIATHKSEKVIKETKAKIIEIVNNDELPEKEKNKQIAVTTIESGGKVLLYFSCVAGLQFGSIKALLSLKESVDNLKAERTVLITMIATEIEKMRNYRKIIAGKIGAEAEEEAYYGAEKKVIPIKENGKIVNKKVRVLSGEPANKNILLFAPWTTDLYIDLETYGCVEDVNITRIKAVMKQIGRAVNFSTNRYVTNNDIADMLHIQKTVEWQTMCFVYGDEIHWSIRKLWTEYDGRWIPVYYLEINSLPLTIERLKKVLPMTPDFAKDISEGLMKYPSYYTEVKNE